MPAREFLMIPGPTPVPDAVLEAVGRHPIAHRSADFSNMLRECVEGLRWLGADTQNDVFILTSSGTGAMEAAIANVVNAGDKVLSLVCGVFSERWAKICQAYGADVERMKFEPGEAYSVEAVRQRLSQDKDRSIKAVTITHNETSTGVINDLQQLAQLTHDHGALSIVDAVTSFGACPIAVDEVKVDLLITGSQKALMLPPGLAYIFVSPRAWEAQAKCKTRRFYFDLSKYRKSLDDNTTPFTPNVSLVAGMQVSLGLMRKEGLEHIFARHIRMKEMLRAGLTALGLELFVKGEHASPTITSILPPTAIPVDAIRKLLKERFRIVVADGQESLKGKIFRIGHMGYVFERDILMTLASLETALRELGHKCASGEAVEAALAAK